MAALLPFRASRMTFLLPNIVHRRGFDAVKDRQVQPRQKMVLVQGRFHGFQFPKFVLWFAELFLQLPIMANRNF
jgi:hypothetical protein